MNPGGRNDVVESYFRLGFDYTEILFYLMLFYGISLSLRQLKRAPPAPLLDPPLRCMDVYLAESRPFFTSKSFMLQNV